MKTVAVIKNPLFKDYIRIVSTDNLSKVIEHPDLPLDFKVEMSAKLKRSDEVANLLNSWFIKKKLEKKDFILNDEDVDAQLKFFMQLISLVSDNVDSGAFIKEKVITEDKFVANNINSVIQEDSTIQVATSKIEDPIHNKETVLDKPISHLDFVTSEVVQEDAKSMIDGLNLAVGTEISFFKSESLKAILMDEKTVVFDGVKMSLMDATKKAFKQSGHTGLPLGLGNWLHDGKTLKEIKDEMKD